MNFNLPYLLQNGMKILNIVNKSLPLVREFNPALSFITKKLKTMNNNIQQNISTPLMNSNIIKNTNNKQPRTHNNLTFFR